MSPNKEAAKPASKGQLIYALATVGSMTSALATAINALRADNNEAADAALQAYLAESRDLVEAMKKMGGDSSDG